MLLLLQAEKEVYMSHARAAKRMEEQVWRLDCWRHFRGLWEEAGCDIVVML